MSESELRKAELSQTEIIEKHHEARFSLWQNVCTRFSENPLIQEAGQFLAQQNKDHPELMAKISAVGSALPGVSYLKMIPELVSGKTIDGKRLTKQGKYLLGFTIASGLGFFAVPAVAMMLPVAREQPIPTLAVSTAIGTVSSSMSWVGWGLMYSYAIEKQIGNAAGFLEGKGKQGSVTRFLRKTENAIVNLKDNLFEKENDD